MEECSTCGTALAAHQIRCPTCGKVTAQYHRQRRCMHCGTPAATQAKSCIMCHKPVDSLPLNRSIFSGSWLGIALGTFIVVVSVIALNRYNTDAPAQAVNVVVNTPTTTPTFTATPTSTNTPQPPTLTPTITPVPTATPRVHLIEPGETLLFVSQRYGVPLNVLIDFNRMEGSEILSVGQEILIPPALTDTGAEDHLGTLPPQMVYVVKSGDTLSSIGFEYGTTVETIIQANLGVDLDLIFPGQEIVVPLSTPTATATPTPLPTETATPRPDYPAPNLLTPANSAIINQPAVLLNWISPLLLDSDEFYVVQLHWPTGQQSEHWLKTSSLRINKDDRLAAGNIRWTVTIRRKGSSSENTGEVALSPPGETRTFEWR